jgi:pyruvate dehydrogenase E1 component alpha subunit
MMKLVHAEGAKILPFRVSREPGGCMTPSSGDLRREILRSMILVRVFEDQLTRMVREEHPPPGIQILSTGQEAAVATILALRDDDVIVSNHRSHAHLLARGADPRGLLAEIMGKATGVNRGKSGTLHLIVPEVNVLMTSTVVGAGPPMAAGSAFAQQYRGEDAITVVFFGDGAAAEGSVHEAMNLASVWKLPLLLVCENNLWAGAQPLRVHCAGEGVASRAASYGMSSERVDGNDADAIHDATLSLVSEIRAGEGPALLELATYRMHGHSEQDPQHYVDPGELEEWAQRDPIQRYQERLLAQGICGEAGFEEMWLEAESAVNEALAFAEGSPDPPSQGIMEHVWAPDLLLDGSGYPVEEEERRGRAEKGEG